MKILESLSVLNKDEWFSLRKFLLMNFREDSDVILLFEEIKKRKRKFEDEKFLSKIKDKFFLGLTQKNYSNLQSKLYQELQNWLVFYDVSNNFYKHEIQLIRSLNTRGLFTQASQVFHKTEAKILQSELLSMEKNFYLHQLYHTVYYSDNPIKYKRPQLLTSLIHAFFDSTQEKSLIYRTESHNWGQIKNIDFSNEKTILKVLNSALPVNKTAESLSLLQSLIIHHDLDSFNKLYSSIIDDAYEKNTELITIIHLYAIHYSSVLWNKGEITDGTIIGNLIDKAFESGTVMSQGKIPLVRFLNYISYYHNRLDKGEAKQFVYKWVHSVDTVDKSATEKLGLALVAFYYEEFPEILEILKENISTNIGIKVRSQLLILIAYTEDLDQYYEILSNSLTNFFRQLKRSKQKIGPNFYKGLMNTAKVIEIIKDHKYNGRKITLKEYPIILFRKWVLRKIEEGY